MPHTHETLLSMVDGYLGEHGAPLDPGTAGERAGSVCFTPYFHVMGFVANFVFNLCSGCRAALLARPASPLSPRLMLAACDALCPSVINVRHGRATIAMIVMIITIVMCPLVINMRHTPALRPPQCAP